MTDSTTLACKQVVEMVTAYLDKTLDSATTRRLEQHLAVCEPCQVYIQQFRTTIAQLGHVPVEGLSPATRATIASAFGQLHSSRPADVPDSP
jgi:anti-sigma factor RsiW